MRATVGAFAVASAVHAAWGLRIQIPGVDGAALSEAVAGVGEMPGPVACFAVAGALASAAALVAGVPPLPSRLVLAGRAGVVLGVGGRGLLGILGRTDLVAPGEVTERFRRWDRRLYTPLCLGLAAGTGARPLARPLADQGEEPPGLVEADDVGHRPRTAWAGRSPRYEAWLADGPQMSSR